MLVLLNTSQLSRFTQLLKGVSPTMAYYVSTLRMGLGSISLLQSTAGHRTLQRAASKIN